ncbi:MAG TPA: GNAT family N-acetyltransferase [Jatrophihabitans sp.]|nr:GNAT family N-acetyltransferase [Jatrophihabitans sp.]
MTVSAELLDIDVVSAIDEVPAAAWDALAGSADLYQSSGWLGAIERDTTATARYLLARSADRLIGALPVYRVDHEVNPAYLPLRSAALRQCGGDHLLAGARRGYHSELLIEAGLPTPAGDQVAAALVEHALKLAAADGRSGIAFRYLPTETLRRLARIAPVVASLDSGNTTIEGVVGGLASYLAGCSAKLRAKIRRELRRYAATGWRIETIPLAEQLSDVARLVSAVEQRHGHATPDLLLRRLFRRELSFLGERVVAFGCHDQQDQLVACAINYAWRDTLYSRAVGLDYLRIPGSFAYFKLLIYHAIEYAAEHGFNRLALGLATPAKVERGAVLRPVWAAALPCEARNRPVGISIAEPDTIRRWVEPYRCYSHALTESDWLFADGIPVLAD